MKKLTHRDVATGFANWRSAHATWIPRTWAHHLAACSRPTITKAIQQKRLKTNAYPTPTGTLHLVDPQDLAALGRSWLPPAAFTETTRPGTKPAAAEKKRPHRKPHTRSKPSRTTKASSRASKSARGRTRPRKRTTRKSTR